jgi:hypothetical protein
MGAPGDPPPDPPPDPSPPERYYAGNAGNYGGGGGSASTFHGNGSPGVIVITYDNFDGGPAAMAAFQTFCFN